MSAALKLQQSNFSLAPIQDVSHVRAWSEDPTMWEFFRRFPPAWAQSDDSLRSLLGTSYYIRTDDNGPVGIISLTNADGVARKVDFGIAIKPHNGRRELATQACKVLADYVFNGLGYNKLVCQVLASREDLVKVLTPFGFAVEGTLRESCFWRGEYHDEKILSLLKKDYTHGT